MLQDARVKAAYLGVEAGSMNGPSLICGRDHDAHPKPGRRRPGIAAVAQGQIVAVLEPNGAGKSELVSGIAGSMRKRSGSVRLGDLDLTDLKPDSVRAAGVAAVPEGHHVLAPLSVDDNLRAAGSMHDPQKLRQTRERAYTVFPELRPLHAQPAGSLSSGQQQMVSLAQAIVADPRFLLADEMSLGLAPVVLQRLMTVLQSLKQDGIGILLIEQFIHLALGVADHACVLNQGRVVYSGSPSHLRDNPEILSEAYLKA